MSLRFTNPKAHHIPFNLQPNEGPKRGDGRGPVSAVDLLTNGVKNRGPKRGTGKPPEITPPVYQALKPSKVVEPKRIENTDFSANLLPNSGPKRGFGLGPAAFEHIDPTKGPKRGIGAGPGIDPLTLFEKGGTKEEQLCVHLTNEFRKKNGKPPLRLSKALCNIALPHTRNMLSGKVPFGHSGFHERSQDTFKLGFHSTGENVAWCNGYSDPIKCMIDGWIKSPGHRANMLGNFTYIGVAFAHDGSKWYGTQFFGS